MTSSPPNVMVDPRGRSRVLDFGIARLGRRGCPRTDADAGDAPDALYAAPEQFRREEATTATDIYALGALLFFMRRPDAAVAKRTGSGRSAGLWQADARCRGAAAKPVNSSRMRSGGQAARRGDLDAIVLAMQAIRPTVMAWSVIWQPT